MNTLESLKQFEGQKSAMLAELFSWVNMESPTTRKASVDRFGEHVSSRFSQLEMSLERVPVEQKGDHWIAKWDGTGSKVLILCHLDTVWGLGTIDTMPARTEGDVAYGPGIFDMKGGILLTLYALRELHRQRLHRSASITVLLTSDEEEGSATSRTLIEQEAKTAACALVLEPAGPHNSIKTKRRGPGRFEITVHGKPAHAGVEPEKGVNAIHELSHQIIEVQKWNQLRSDISVHVGLIKGGTRTNVIPAQAEAIFDVRADSPDGVEWLKNQFRQLKSQQKQAQIEIEGDFERPPLERSPAVIALFEEAYAIGRSFDYTVAEYWTGGASDGNFTAALGVPTLDGLGPEGGAAHAVNEHILISSLPKRTNLLYHLIRQRAKL